MGAMTVAELQVLVNARIDKLERALDEAEKRTDRFAKRAKTDVERASASIDRSFENLIKGSQRLGIALTAGITLPLAALAKKALSNASDLQESMSKTQQVFRDSTAVVTAFSKASADAFGVSKQAALDYASSFGLILQAGGKTEEQSARMSVELSKLAADLASFYNVDIETAAQKLKSGLVGEAEPLRAFGVLLSESAVKARALAMGLKTTSGELSEASKVQARYAIILDQTVKAHGDFARTSDGLANSQRKLQAKFTDMSGELGTRLLPYALKVVKTLDDLLDRFEKLSPPVQEAFIKLGLVAGLLGPMTLAFSGLARASVGVASFFGTVVLGADGATVALGRTKVAVLGLSRALGVLGIAWAGYEVLQAKIAGFYAGNAKKLGSAQAEIDAADDAAYAKGEFVPPGNMRGVLQRAAERLKAKKAAEALARASAAVATGNTGGGSGGRGGGGGGGGGGQSEAAQATERLRGVIADLNREVALGGDKTKLAALKWELLNGEYAKASPVVKAAALALQAQAEAMERAREAQDSYRETLREVYKQTQLGAAATEVERANIERLAKGLPALTEAQQAQLGAAIDRRDAEKEYREALERSKHSMGPYAQLGLAIAANYRDQTNALRQTTAAIEREIDLLKTKGDVEAALYELEGRHGRFKGASKEAGDAFLDATKQLAAMGFVKQWVANLKAAAEAGAEARKQAALAADGRFAEYMGDLAKRVKLLGANSREAALALELMGKGFAVDPKSAEGIARLQEAIKATLEVERIERFRAELDKLKNSLEQGFMSMFDRILGGGFRNLFSNILQGFRQLLSDIAREFLASQIRGLLTRALGNLFGGGGGSALASGGGGGIGPVITGFSLAGRAVGGPVMRGEPYLVGEHGPELMVPNQSGRVLTARETSRVKGGQQVVNVTINATDAPSFARSRDMVAAEIGHAIARANRRGGR